MKFLVTRTSLDDEVKPCVEALQETYTRIDERTTDDPAKIFHGKDWWYDEGKNHRVENDHIKRDFDETGWFIVLKDLDELLKFQKKYGDLIITTHWENRAIISIIINDEPEY